MRRIVVALVLIVGWLVSSAVPAGAAPGDPTWSGDYSLLRFAASKYGSSLAARQPEPDFADTYTFRTDCAGGPCIATVINGPRPANPTLPQPPTYSWDGVSWVHEYAWEWDCYQGEGVPKVWMPATSVAYYTPQPDGTFTGLWRTDIVGGPCDGTVFMNIAAYPVPSIPPMFGSS